MSDEIWKCVAEALKRANELLPPKDRVLIEQNTVIAGSGAAYESLSLVNFALFLEEELSNSSTSDMSVLDLLVELSGEMDSVTVADLVARIRAIKE